MNLKKTIILFILTLVIIPLTARDVVPFNTGWQFKKGPFSSDPVIFNHSFGDRWKDVTIPHTWNASDMQIDKNVYYEGEAYYKKMFTPETSMTDKRVFLRFEGVASVAEVYINGVFAGNHKGAYSAFAVEIGNLLKAGKENEILVKVDNAARADVIPINQTLFGVYGGMYRPVEMIITDKINIAVTDYASPGVYLRQQNVSATSADVSVKVKVENKYKEDHKISLLTTIYTHEDNVIIKQESPFTISPQGRHFLEQNLKIDNPHLWQGLDDPYLYKAVVQIVENGRVVDEVVQPLGLRHFELKAGDGMYLNGKKVSMYGTCRHQEWWKYGSALSNEQHATDLDIIKELGATTIRFAHYQQAEYIYAKCDSIGFMVWAEIPFVNRVSTKEADNAKQQLKELIRQNYNHPSIYVWGLHNEVYTPYEATIALTTDLNDLAKSEDPDRYTVAVNGYGRMEHEVNLNADIQGINRYFGWYEKKIGDLEGWAKELEEKYPTYKTMLAEYGAEANIDQQQEKVGEVGNFFSQFYPETFATKFHEIQWGIISEHPYLLASYVWNTFDFATPRNHQGGVPARNMKGLVTYDRKVKKDPFYWYKANWSKEPVLYLTQRRCNERVNQTTTVTAYSNVGTPKLIVNGNEIKSFRKGTTDVHYIFENVELKEGNNTIEAKVSKNGQLYEDSIEWHFSKSNEGNSRMPEAKEKTEEHGGL